MPKHIDGISEKQHKAIQLLVYSDKGPSEIAEEVGVNRTNFWKWRTKDEQFKEALAKERSNKFHMYGDVAQKELLKLIVDSSDKRTQLQAIKMVMQELGYLVDKQQVTAKTEDFIVKITTEAKEL